MRWRASYGEHGVVGFAGEGMWGLTVLAPFHLALAVERMRSTEFQRGKPLPREMGTA